MPYPVQCFFEIHEVIVQILLIFKILITRESVVEDLFCGVSPGFETCLFFSDNLFSLGLEPVQDDFKHDFTLMTDEISGAVILAQL